MLYLVATSIGNYSDISLHAAEILKQADYIACEDTRETGKLLKHLGIKKPLISFFEHNEDKKLNYIFSLLNKGKAIALVSDRGMPGISDPGYKLVRRAIDENAPFSVIPGPSAFILALIVSGLPVHSFVFRGFPPRASGKRKKFLEADKDLLYTLIYYESPHRLLKFLEHALSVLGDRKCCIANDLTKKYESISRGRLSEMIAQLSDASVKGEFTIVIAGIGDEK